MYRLLLHYGYAKNCSLRRAVMEALHHPNNAPLNGDREQILSLKKQTLQGWVAAASPAVIVDAVAMWPRYRCFISAFGCLLLS